METFVREEAREVEEEGTKKKNATTTTTTTTTMERLESEDDRPVSIAFRGNARGFLRQRVIHALRSLNRADWDLDADGATTETESATVKGSTNSLAGMADGAWGDESDGETTATAGSAGSPA